MPDGCLSNLNEIKAPIAKEDEICENCQKEKRNVYKSKIEMLKKNIILFRIEVNKLDIELTIRENKELKRMEKIQNFKVFLFCFLVLACFAFCIFFFLNLNFSL